jgi:hypothetical protein
VNAAPDNINANEKADAPKIKARDCLTPKAMLPQPVVVLLFGWRAPLIRAAACWLPISANGPGSFRVDLGYAASRNRSIITGCSLYRL